ncbi:DNA-binding transcriptional activator FeaR [compost metagenome]
MRYAEARQQLRLSAQSITDLALHLGYADETAFSRAFKRWSGTAPQLWRKANADVS